MKEYKVIEMLDPMPHELERELNKYAKDGWEVVSTNFWNSCTDAILIVMTRDA